VSGEIEVGGMHWVRDRRDRWISYDVDVDVAVATEVAMLDEIERLHGIVDLVQQLLRESAEANSRLKAEIERLRVALALAVGELSTHAAYAVYSPDQLLEQFMQEARRG
jgi:hypothetical protein